MEQVHPFLRKDKVPDDGAGPSSFGAGPGLFSLQRNRVCGLSNRNRLSISNLQNTRQQASCFLTEPAGFGFISYYISTNYKLSPGRPPSGGRHTLHEVAPFPFSGFFVSLQSDY
jgi:hypothetical protein